MRDDHNIDNNAPQNYDRSRHALFSPIPIYLDLKPARIVSEEGIASNFGFND